MDTLGMFRLNIHSASTISSSHIPSYLWIWLCIHGNTSAHHYIGVAGHLLVSIEPYVPHVHCSAPRPGGLAPGSCQKVLEAMPISNLRTEFIEAGQRTASDQVVVPRIFDSSQFVVLLA